MPEFPTARASHSAKIRHLHRREGNASEKKGAGPRIGTSRELALADETDTRRPRPRSVALPVPGAPLAAFPGAPAVGDVPRRSAREKPRRVGGAGNGPAAARAGSFRLGA